MIEVKDFGSYRVHSDGRVWSTYREKFLTPGDNGNGYKFVILYEKGKRKRFYIHRLVASLFIPNPNNLPQINHKDENRSNNDVSNLEWCNAQYNVDYSQSKCVLQYDLIGNCLGEYKSTNEASRCTGVDQSGISKCCLGKISYLGGYIWKYK